MNQSGAVSLRRFSSISVREEEKEEEGKKKRKQDRKEKDENCKGRAIEFVKGRIRV